MRSYRCWTGGRLLLVSLDPARVLSDFAFGVHHLQQDLAPCGDVRSLMPCSPHDRRTPLLLHHVAFFDAQVCATIWFSIPPLVGNLMVRCHMDTVVHCKQKSTLPLGIRL